MASKYDPLHEHIKKLSANGQRSWHASFAEIERILMFKLPRSAHRHNAWWANEKSGNHSHARSWMNAGWETRRPNLSTKTVTFERVR